MSPAGHPDRHVAGANLAALLRPSSQVPISPGERTLPADVLLERIRPHLAALGVSRLGLLTGLDQIGVPVAAAYRPNSRTLSVHQGRGLDETTALLSAALEAAEAALAEALPAGLFRASMRDLRDAGWPIIDLPRTLRCRADRIADTRLLDMIVGLDLVTGKAIAVPHGLVGLDHTVTRDDAFDGASDGLGAGATLAEAALHGLLELVERDAAALFSVLGADERRARALDPAAFQDARIDALSARVAAAGLTLSLADMTSDLAVPVIAARLRPLEGRGGPVLATDVCGGFGCHDDPATAAVKAITEACQARVTAIAGARDDIGAAWYRETPTIDPAWTVPNPSACPTPPARLGATPAERLAALVDRLAGARIRQVVVVPLGGEAMGFAVARVIAPGLEIGLEASGRPGSRLLAAMLRSAPP